MIAILLFFVLLPIALVAGRSVNASNGRPVPTQKEIDQLVEMLETNKLAIALEHQNREKGEA